MSEREGPRGYLVLPPSIATRRDVMELLREFVRVDAALVEAELRHRVGATAGGAFTLSDRLTEFLHQNQGVLDDASSRRSLVQRLEQFKDVMPIVHMTFAAQADTESVQWLAACARRLIHPQAVLTIGLQPDLIGGVHIRTTNHVYDLSVRAQLVDARHFIREELEAIYAGR